MQADNPRGQPERRRRPRKGIRRRRSNFANHRSNIADLTPLLRIELPLQLPWNKNWCNMNLEQIRGALIFIIATTTLNGCKSQKNFSIPTDFRLSSMMIPVHYDVKLFFPNLDAEDRSKPLPSFITDNYDNYFYGDSSITVNIFRSTRNIKLHILDLDLSYWPELIRRDGAIFEPKNITSKGNLLDLYFSNLLFPGLYNLKLDSYGRTTNDNATEGFFRTSHRKEDGHIAWIIATRIQTIGARRLFPCWDNPQIRTTFKISIQHPRNSVALSNMPIRGRNSIHQIKWTYFHTTPPISTCHIALAVTNYNYIRINENASLWCRECFEKNTFEFAKLVIKRVTSHLTSEFKKITIPKVDHVAIPNFPQDGTSKLGLIFYGEANLIYNEDLDTSMHKINIARLIAPRIAYQWFGNAVSPSRWSSFWLHDGLATFFGEEAIAKINNNSTLLDFFIVENQYDSLHLDSHFNMNPLQMNNLSETNLLYRFPRYIKVPIILRMLQNAITDEGFRRGVHMYLHKYMFNSVTLYEFFSTQENIAKTYGYYISKEFLNWISYRHYPVLSWTQKDGKLTQNFNASNYGKWWIPINLVVETSVMSESYKLWLTQQSPYFHINTRVLNMLDWVMIDIQQAGYYRINYDDENWQKITRYLNSFIFRNITVINRAKIIDDAFHLTIARQLNISTFWQITDHLWHDTNFVAWYPMIKIFEYLSNVLPFYESSTSIIIKRKLNDLLEHSFKVLRYVYLEENDFLKCLKLEILKWACMLHHGPCLTLAKEKLLRYLEPEDRFNINSNKIIPEWKEWVFCNGLREANISVWNTLKQRWLKEDHKLLPYLACTRDSSIILEWLPYVQWNPSTSTTQDTAIIRSYINIFHTIVAKHANNYSILTNILLILKKIKPKEISTIVALTDIINHVYSEKHLTKIRYQLEHQQFITDKQQISKIQRKIQLRSSEIKNEIIYFQFIHD